MQRHSRQHRNRAATTIIEPASNATINSDTTITVIAPDNTNWMTFNISNSTGNYTTTGTQGITNDTNRLDGFIQNWQTANFADGLYNLSVHSYDAAGNLLSTDNATDITIDNTAPNTVTITTLPANLNVNVINLNWTPSASTDVNYYNLYRSTNISFQISPGARIQNLSANITQDTVLDGTWYYKVTAVDTAGQESQPSNEVNVTVLTGGPTGQLFGTLKVNNSIVSNGASILFTFEGSSTDLNVTINTTEIQKLDNSSGALHLNDSGINGDFGADDGTYSAVFTISSLNNESDGRKILISKVNDSAANEFFPKLNITLDNTNPNATISILGTSPAGWTNVSTEYTTSRLATLILTFNDTFGINACRLANEDLTFTGWETCTTVKAWILSENAGNKTVILEVRDNAENIIRTNDTIFLNTTAAGLDLTPPNTPTVTDDGKYTNTKHKLHATWNTTDPQSEQLHIPLEYEYRISFNNLTEFINTTWTYVGTLTDIEVIGLNLTNNTNYTFEIRAINTASIRSNTGYSNGIIVDITPPTAPGITSTHSNTNWTRNNQVQFNWTSNDTISGIQAYSYILDANQTTRPDQTAETENQHTTLKTT